MSKVKLCLSHPCSFRTIRNWESNQNSLPSRHISVEKLEGLNKIIDDLQTSIYPTFQDYSVVSRPSFPETIGGRRCTVDYRGLIKSNQMRECHPSWAFIQTCALVTDVPNVLQSQTSLQLFSNDTTWTLLQIHSHYILPGYLWMDTSPRVFSHLLISPKKTIGVYVLNGLLYKVCEVYIDDICDHG